MLVVCAWCDKPMKEVEPLDDKSESHGICPECLGQHFPTHADLIERILAEED